MKVAQQLKFSMQTKPEGNYLDKLNLKFIIILFFQIQSKEKNKMLFQIIIPFLKKFENFRITIQDGIGVNIFQMVIII